MERCLACEAEVSKGRSVAHPISVGALCLEFRGVTRKRGGRDMLHGWRPHGLASEATLHGWRPLPFSYFSISLKPLK